MICITVQTPVLRRVSMILGIKPKQITFVSTSVTHLVIGYDDECGKHTKLIQFGQL